MEPSEATTTGSGRSQGERLLEVLAARERATVAELAAETGISRRSTAAAVARLAGAGRLQRLGRGVVATGQGVPRVEGLQIGSEGKRVLATLRDVGVPAQLTGYDPLAPLANQLPSSWMHLVIVERGSGDWAADTLRTAGFVPVVEPTRQQMKLLAELGLPRVVVLRERSLGGPGTTVRGLEQAWVDLMVEQRAGYPIGLSELGELLLGLSSAGVSWTRLARAAQRRSLPLRVDPARRPVPLAVGPGKADDLQRVLDA